MMNVILMGITAGILGTISMDTLNILFSRTGLITRIDVKAIGRMAAGWTRGRFRYGHPGEMVEVRREQLLGLLTHYAIGVGLSVPFVVGWAATVGEPAPPAWALAYGVGTTVASWFFVYPSMGFGMLGLKSPDGLKASVSSLANHLFYGLGLAAGVALA